MKTAKILLLALILIAGCHLPAWAANTTVVDGNFIYVTFDGSTAWSIKTDAKLTQGAAIYSISVRPAAAADAATVRNQSAAGIPIFSYASATGDALIEYYGGVQASPYVVGNEVTSGSKMLIVLSAAPLFN